MLPLSQGHLKALNTCARKYRYIFLDALSGPTSYEHHTTTQWGSQFHLLMQQQALALPVEVMAEASAEMMASMDGLKQAAPEVFDAVHSTLIGHDLTNAEFAKVELANAGSLWANSQQPFAQSEQRRTLAFNDYLLTVIYDWVSFSCDGQGVMSGQIFDWKTHQKPPRREWLVDDWQTRLYLYVLCETANVLPSQVSMTYWFVRLSPSANQEQADSQAEPAEDRCIEQPSAYRFSYSTQQHEQTRQDLLRLTNQLTQMRSQNEFPKVAIEKGECNHCLFNVRCDRMPASQPDTNAPFRLLQEASELTADTVEEIPL